MIISSLSFVDGVDRDTSVLRAVCADSCWGWKIGLTWGRQSATSRSLASVTILHATYGKCRQLSGVGVWKTVQKAGWLVLLPGRGGVSSLYNDRGKQFYKGSVPVFTRFCYWVTLIQTQQFRQLKFCSIQKQKTALKIHKSASLPKPSGRPFAICFNLKWVAVSKSNAFYSA